MIPLRRPGFAQRRTPQGRPGHGHGFTMVEVLVTVVVTLIAFTGLATVQLLSLRAAASSSQRSQASALAYELVDRLRLNRGENGLADSALGGGYDGTTLCHAGSRHANDGRTCTIGALANVTGTGSVAADLRAWWTALDNAGLPHWYAGLLRNDGEFTVSVQWDDARAEDGGDAAAATQTSCLGSLMPSAMQEVCVVTQL